MVLNNKNSEIFKDMPYINFNPKHIKFSHFGSPAPIGGGEFSTMAFKLNPADYNLEDLKLQFEFLTPNFDFKILLFLFYTKESLIKQVNIIDSGLIDFSEEIIIFTCTTDKISDLEIQIISSASNLLLMNGRSLINKHSKYFQLNGSEALSRRPHISFELRITE